MRGDSSRGYPRRPVRQPPGGPPGMTERKGTLAPSAQTPGEVDAPALRASHSPIELEGSFGNDPRELGWPSGLYWRPIGVSAARVPGSAQSSGTPDRRGCLAWRGRSAVASRLLGGLGTALCDPEVGGDCACQGKHVAGAGGPTARTAIAAILRIRPVAPDDPEGGRREDLLVCLVDVVHFSLHGRAPERDLTCRCKRVPPGESPKWAKSHPYE